MTPYFQDNHVTLYLGDCMDLLVSLPPKAFDLAIVDPPYGIGAENHAGTKQNGWRQWDKKDWDSCRPSKKYFESLYAISTNQIIWGANYYPEYLPSSMGWIIWDKGQRDFSLADAELAFSSFEKAVRICEISRAASSNEGTRIHPTQKPVALYRWLLANYAKPRQTILDTHLGSGSIAIACHYAGHHLTAIEKDEEYLEAAVKRYQRETAQQDMFAHSPLAQPQLEQAALL